MAGVGFTYNVTECIAMPLGPHLLIRVSFRLHTA
jgi:hypothetical protein